MTHRRPAYTEYGDPQGLPVIYCHGFPSSRREAQFLHTAALGERARIISADRPGYGDSEYQPERQITGWAQDVAILADYLGLEQFAILAVSGGSPYALACAWRLPERINGCTLVCPLGPIYLKSALSEMNLAARFNLVMARHAPRISEFLLGGVTTYLYPAWPQLVGRLRRLNASDADMAELANPRTRHLLDQTIADAMRSGARGARQDLLLYTRDWGIPLDEIDLQLDIWHGMADGIVPVSHSRWYAAHLRGARVHYVPNEGHYSLPMRHGKEILGNLLAPMRRQTNHGEKAPQPA